jgi:TonB-linked SusC/RagA family outer membrane protein
MKKNDCPAINWSRYAIKWLLIMNLTVVLSFIFSFQALAVSCFSQNKVSLNMKSATLVSILQTIEKRSDYRFVFGKEVVSDSTRRDIYAKDADIDYVMQTLLQTSDLSYKKLSNDLVVIVGENIRYIKAIPITGKIIDDKGTPIPGVSIVEKGTTNGVTTNGDGSFSINVNGPNSVLVITSIGYQQKEVVVGDNRTFDIQLTNDIKVGDEAVVIGYGVLRKRDLTGSVSSITEGNFTMGSNTNALQMINGRAAGVNISQANSAPGASTKIQIRGAGSINSSNAALVVVDGLPGVDPTNINPDDIKSIEVLKDASAGAIYGTRAANGVVLITTKGGRKGDVTVKLGSEFGSQQVAKRIDVLNAQQYMSILNAIRKESGRDTIFTAAQMQGVGAGTNWQDQIFNNAALVQNHALSISGGSEKADYYVALNYFNQDGLVKNSDYKKYNVRANLNINAKSFLRFKFNVNATRGLQNTILESMYSANEGAGPINAAIQFDPTLSTGIDPVTGRYFMNSFISLDNPLALIHGIKNENLNTGLYGTFTTEIEPVKDLVLTTRIGGSINSYINSFYRNRMTMTGLANGGSGSKLGSDNTQWLAEFLLNYSKTFAEIHKISFLAGTTFEKFLSQSISGSSTKFLSDATGSDLLQGSDVAQNRVFSGKQGNQLHGVLGRVNYDLLGRYLLTASFRYDGSSRFSKKNKYALFPSAALAWRISNESFFNVNAINDLKLRLGYGQLGNQGIGNYATLQTLVAGGSAVFGNTLYSGVVQARNPNLDLKWETTEEWNLGLDFGILKDRINGSIEYFVKNTRDQLFSKNIGSMLPVSNILVNAGNVKNTGWDILLNTVNVKNNNFSWESSLNMSFLKNEVSSLPDFMTRVIRGQVSSFVFGFQLVEKGTPIDAFYGYQVDGVYQTNDDLANAPKLNGTVVPKAGHLKFRDQNNDGKINADDRVVLGSPFPNFTGGFNNRFKYKKLSLDVFLQWVSGVKTIDGNVLESLYPTNEYRNRIATYYLNRWTETNPSNEYPSGVNYAAYGGDFAVNSLTVTDASFMRLKTISLNYDFDKIRSNVFKGAQVYLAADNIFTFTKFEGYDPDASGAGANSTAKFNYNSYPLARTIRLGFNVTF